MGLNHHVCILKFKFFQLSTITILSWTTLSSRGCPVHYKLFTSILDSTHGCQDTRLPSSDVQKCLQLCPNVPWGTKLSPVENHCSKWSSINMTVFSLMTYMSFLTFYFLIYFYLEDNCFTVLYWFLPYNDVNQLWVDPCPPSPEPPSHPLPHPTPLGCHRALGWASCVI